MDESSSRIVTVTAEAVTAGCGIMSATALCSSATGIESSNQQKANAEETTADKSGLNTKPAQYGDDFGKMGQYVENPNIKVDWSQYAAHGAKRMQQRGMTQEMIENIIENGKVLSQSGGDKFAYITQEGVAVVSKEGNLITAWSSANFDENMIEIVKALFGE